MLTGLRAKLWAIGAALLAALAVVLRIQGLKNSRDKAQHRAAVAEARHFLANVEKNIKKKEEKRLSEGKALIKEKVEKGETLDNLSNPNDF